MPGQVLQVQVDDGEWLEVEGERLRIGRSPRCDVVLAHSNVSRLHAEILRRDGRFLLRAVSELFLDGRDVKSLEVRGGEELGVGYSPHVLRLRLR